MKKTLALILALVLCVGLFSGCRGQTDQNDNPSTDTQITQPAEDTDTQPDESVQESPTPAEDEKTDLSGQTLMIYCGAGMTNPFQEIADLFQTETGCEMNVTFANAAQIQTQITETKSGDFFIAGSADEVKPVSEQVERSKDLVKHIPVLVVAEKNPLSITGITDLANENVRTVIGDPESTPIGKIAQKAFSDFGVTDSVNLIATTTTAPQLATVISLGEADAAIIWKENAENVEGIEILETPDMDKYVKTVPAAQLTSSDGNGAAEVFYTFLDSEEVQAIWARYGYEQLG